MSPGCANVRFNCPNFAARRTREEGDGGVRPHDSAGAQFAELWQQIADVMNRLNLTDQIVQPGKENIGRTINSIPITIQCAGRSSSCSSFSALRRFDRAVRIEKCQLLNDNDFSGQLKLNAVATIFYQTSGGSGS